MLLSLSLSIILLSINRLTISYNCPLITSSKLVSTILVLLPKVTVASVVGVLTVAFSGILFNFFYRNRGSNYIITPSRSTTVDALIG
jgi:hypothetical protein